MEKGIIRIKSGFKRRCVVDAGTNGYWKKFKAGPIIAGPAFLLGFNPVGFKRDGLASPAHRNGTHLNQ
jgi:hypothetical protein